MAQGVVPQTDLQNPRILTLHLALHRRTEKWAPGAYGLYSQKWDFTPSGSGCLSPEGEGLQPAISVQSFVPCAGLAVS